MERLPVELVTRICWHLCAHCHSPDPFPGADDDEETRADKAALARLSRTCRFLRAVAQPVVFHYYTTGNLPLMAKRTVEPGYFFSPSSWKPTNDRLPLFLRSIVERADLAKCVQALQLVQSDILNDYHSSSFNDRKASEFGCPLMRASLLLGVNEYNSFHPNYHCGGANRADLELDAHTSSDEIDHHALEQMAMALCPNVKTLLLMGNFEPASYGYVLKKSGRTLPSLKTIGLLSEARKFHYSGVLPLLSLAPNLDTVYAVDLKTFIGRAADLERRARGPRSLTETTLHADKLVVHDLSQANLRHLFESCPRLQELRYTQTFGFIAPNGIGMTCDMFARVLEPVRNTLHRLSYAFLPDFEAPDDSDDWDDVDADSMRVVESFRGFERLQELTISHVAIYGPYPNNGDDGGDGEPVRVDLVGFLPRSIARVHFSHVGHEFTTI